MWVNVAAVFVSLAAFLLALRVMRKGLEGMGEHQLQRVIQRFVRTPTRGIVTGLVTTAFLQSSAAVTAIAVGFVAAETMAFRDAVGIVLGANVGATVTPQLLTMDLWIFAVPCLVAGGIGLLLPSQKLCNPSMALVGLASIFIALQALATALEPIAETDEFVHILQSTSELAVIALLGGMICSAVIQSSTATTVLAMALVADSAIPVTSGIAIVIGANVGTCLTSVLAAVGQSRAAQQVALSHVLLNVGGAAVSLPLLAPFADWMASWSSEPAQQIANAHTVFNVICTIAVWPFTRLFADFVERILPNKRHA